MARPRYPSDQVDKLMLRFPAGMRKWLERRAKENFRSMNGEVIAILSGLFDHESQSAAGSVAAPPAASPKT